MKTQLIKTRPTAPFPPHHEKEKKVAGVYYESEHSAI